MNMQQRVETNTITPIKMDSKNKAGLKAYFSITKEWGLTSGEQRKLLGDPEPENFSTWKVKKAGDLTLENKERILQVLRIYRALNSLYSRGNVLIWLKHINKNPLFNNRSPIQHMLTGRMSALSDVRSYLDWVQE